MKTKKFTFSATLLEYRKGRKSEAVKSYQEFLEAAKKGKKKRLTTAHC